MFTRRSERLQNQNNILSQNQNQSHGLSLAPSPSPVQQNTNNFSSQQNEIQCEEESKTCLQHTRYFNSPQIQEIISESKEDVIQPAVSVQPVTESPCKNASAITKALNQCKEEDKKKWKKGVKIPMAVRRKKFNQRLSKLLTPKSALILLHELKPGCVYKIQEQSGCIPPSFCAQVEHENVVIGTGQGLSKSQAKNTAAENAIKTIVSKTMSRCSATAAAGESQEAGDDEDTPENLPWAGLASFAIYKMFSEWQNQGADLLSMTRPAAKPKAKVPSIAAPAAVNLPTKKELPPNAAELHPAVVLNMMNPWLTAVELERENGPKCRVTMGYMVEEKMYCGVGGNKKDAKKEAAKAVLEGHYGLIYPS